MSELSASVNGEAVTLPAGSTIADVVAQLTEVPMPKGIAVAVDRSVVPKSEWATTQVRAGANIEVVTAAPGG